MQLVYICTQFFHLIIFAEDHKNYCLEIIVIWFWRLYMVLTLNRFSNIFFQLHHVKHVILIYINLIENNTYLFFLKTTINNYFRIQFSLFYYLLFINYYMCRGYTSFTGTFKLIPLRSGRSENIVRSAFKSRFTIKNVIKCIHIYKMY